MMQDIPTVQSMEAVDLHLRLIMQKLNTIESRQEDMLANMATKAELETQRIALEAKIALNSPRTFWRGLTEIAVGVTALSAAVGVLIAVFKTFKLGGQ